MKLKLHKEPVFPPYDNYDPDLDGPREQVIIRAGREDPVPTINPLTRQPRSKKSSSFSAVVADLGVGDSASRAHSLNQEMTLAEFQRDLKEMKAMIDNNVRPAIAAARKITGGDYRVETGETITTQGRIFLNVIVTRIA